ncbi:MAG: hypothetical protein ACREOZ_02550 [Gloeomargaritales cyanobacterium]
MLLPRLSSGLIACRSACNFVAEQLLRPCSRMGNDGGASEFRLILNNLIDDLLTVLLLPEYPCADMLLLSFTKKISDDLLLRNKGVSSNNGGGW